MTDTANLALPCIEGSQAQKHVTHNEALRLLDSLVQLAVLDRDLTAPPGSPIEGQRWIVKTGATGAWASHVHAIAAWQDGTWQFSTPRTGWLAYVIDESVLLTWNGSAWVDAIGALSPTALNNMTLLGVGTTADATNPLSAKLNNTLFTAKTVAEGGDGHLRYKLSKESAAKTLSFLFQDNYSGRAEIGLTGDDDFRFKVSADGSTWRDGIVIDRATGAVSFPNSTIAGAGRQLLTANRTYYVRIDGSDANSGLANTSGGAFLTVQKAIDTVAALDISTYIATIQIGAGTYAGANALKAPVGSGEVWIIGDETTPANVAISTTGADCFSGTFRGVFRIRGMKLQTTTSGAGINITGGGAFVYFKNMDFGAIVGAQLQANSGASILADGNYTISGSAARHFVATGMGGYISVANTTITLTGTPAFTQFALAANLSFINTPSANVTYSGSATGSRYLVSINAAINVGGGGASFLPGNSAGSAANGGQYV